MKKIHVLTINLRRQTEEDGPDNWPHRKKLTARLIQDTAPHIFGTQEGRKPQIRELLEELEGYTLADKHREWDPARMYPCIFYDTNMFEVVESGDWWLSESPMVHASKSWGSAFPRLAVWARLKAMRDRSTFIFAVTHLDHLSLPARTGQARVLLRLLSRVSQDEIPVILVGDFNDVPGSGPYKILTRRYKDAWLECNTSMEDAHTWHGFSGNGRRGRLDWILTSPDIRIHSAEIMRISYGGSYPSDHFPVRAVLELRTAEEAY